jgi:hypothetical protein
MPRNIRTYYLDLGRVTIECPVLMADATLAGILINFGQELLARPATPAKTGPVNSKLPPKGIHR